MALSGQIDPLLAIVSCPAEILGLTIHYRLPLRCSWIDLGHACASEIQPHSDNTTFLDIFDYAPFNSTTGPCEAGFTSINSGQHWI